MVEIKITHKEEIIPEFDKKNDNKYDKLLDECQGYKYAQSSNFIKLSRTVIFGIIGTIWILSYSNGEFIIHNTYLITSLLFAFLHILIDLLHYLVDMIFYKKEYVRFSEDKGDANAIEKHDKRMDKHATVSFRFVCVNTIALLLSVISFIIGFVFQFEIFE